MMSFSHQRPGEPCDLATLRAICVQVLDRIEKNRSWFMNTCDVREEMQGIGVSGQMSVFGCLVEIGKKVANSSSTLPDDAERFIQGLELKTPARKTGGLGALVNRIRGGDSTLAHNRIREDVIGFLGSYPDFDPGRAREGLPQNEAFMNSLRIDYPIVLDIAASMKRPFGFMNEMEENFGEMVRMYGDFEDLAFRDIDRSGIGVSPLSACPEASTEHGIPAM